VLVKRRDAVNECGQLAEQLHSDQSAANDREREQSAFALRVSLHVGPLEALDHVVAEQEGVGERLEREGVLRTGDHRSVGHRPQRQDQLVVGQFGAFGPGAQVDHAPLQVDLLNRRLDEPGGPQKGADRQGAVAHVQGAGTDLEEQRGHQEEVVPAHQNDLDIRAALAKPFQAASGVDATKAAAENQDAFLRY
jgi:hypothetical protein